jgi:hypothetical protein
MIVIVATRRIAALPSRDFHCRDRDRHIMIKVDAWQNCRAFLRRLSTGNGKARPRAALDSHLVVRSPLCDAGSAERNRSNGVVIPLIASHTSVQQTSATDRRR